jgi:nucleotide-binding universal stress UspA family protein
MSFKDLLVYLDPSAESVERVRFAIDLAKADGARIIGADISTPSAENDVVTRKSFEEVTRESSLDAVFLSSEQSDRAVAFTHCVDLIIAPAPEGEAIDGFRKGVIEHALTDSGAPVLLLPRSWTRASVGRNIVIAWNGGREAARAVHDAMPFLRKAEKVTVFAFSSGPSGLRNSAEILVSHLAAHGIRAGISDWTNAPAVGAVEALFASLDAQEADLFVAGAFGHSRVWEGLFGGVTLDLMHQQLLPVLMSH